jgi:hypothetical protein
MAHTKELLDTVSINNIVEDIRIEQDIFVNDSGQSIKYNRFIIQFDDGQTIKLKLDRILKLEFYMAIKENDKPPK